MELFIIFFVNNFVYRMVNLVGMVNITSEMLNILKIQISYHHLNSN